MSDRPADDIVLAVPLSDEHWSSYTYRQRVTRSDLRKLILAHRTIIRRATVCQLKHRHIGVGVYEIWFDGLRFPSPPTRKDN